MQLKTVKNAADLPFKGVEFVKRDTTIREVIVHGKLHIQSDYGLTIAVRVEGDEAKRHKVTATIEGFGEKVEYFTDAYTASVAVSKYEGMGAKAESQEVTVLVDEFGAAIEGSEKTASAAPVQDMEIAF